MFLARSLALVVSIFICTKSYAWGGRGHHAICEAAVFLLKSEIKDYLKNKPQVMGHLCNIPDTYWKSLPQESRKLGDPGHYINAERLGLKIADIPTDYKKIVSDYTGKVDQAEPSKTLKSVPDELGSNWWRAEQFYRLAVEQGKVVKSSTPPQNNKEEQDENLAFNKAFYQMMVNLGLMGHFVGDNSQPFHNTSDYDGYAQNHGGIHAYYEDGVVSEFGPDLINKIVQEAKKLKNPSFTKSASVIENMKALSLLSVADIKEVLKADPIIKPSQINIEKGMSLKKSAVRKPTSEAFKKMDKLVIKQLARASLLLAYSWDEAYKQAGSPAVKAYKSYQYPFTPDFVKPDYF